MSLAEVLVTLIKIYITYLRLFSYVLEKLFLLSSKTEIFYCLSFVKCPNQAFG